MEFPYAPLGVVQHSFVYTCDELTATLQLLWLAAPLGIFILICLASRCRRPQRPDQQALTSHVAEDAEPHKPPSSSEHLVVFREEDYVGRLPPNTCVTVLKRARNEHGDVVSEEYHKGSAFILGKCVAVTDKLRINIITCAPGQDTVFVPSFERWIKQTPELQLRPDETTLHFVLLRTD